MNKLHLEFLALVAIIYSIMVFVIPAVVAWDTGLSYWWLMGGVCGYLWVPLAVTLFAYFTTILLSHLQQGKTK